MSINNPLFQFISEANHEDFYQIYETKSNHKTCFLKSKTHLDFHFVIHSKKNGFTVEFYNSTYDLTSTSPITIEALKNGLSLFFDGKQDPDSDEVSRYFNWNLYD